MPESIVMHAYHMRLLGQHCYAEGPFAEGQFGVALLWLLDMVSVPLGNNSAVLLGRGLVRSPLGLIQLDAQASMDIQQVADGYVGCHSSLHMISHKLYEAGKPDLEHLGAPILASHLDVGLQPGTHHVMEHSPSDQRNNGWM